MTCLVGCIPRISVTSQSHVHPTMNFHPASLWHPELWSSSLAIVTPPRIPATLTKLHWQSNPIQHPGDFSGSIIIHFYSPNVCATSHFSDSSHSETCDASIYGPPFVHHCNYTPNSFWLLLVQHFLQPCPHLAPWPKGTAVHAPPNFLLIPNRPSPFQLYGYPLGETNILHRINLHLPIFPPTECCQPHHGNHRTCISLQS